MQTPAEGCGIAAGYGIVQAVSGDQLFSHGLPGGKTRVGRYGIWQGRGGCLPKTRLGAPKNFLAKAFKRELH